MSARSIGLVCILAVVFCGSCPGQAPGASKKAAANDANDAKDPKVLKQEQLDLAKKQLRDLFAKKSQLKPRIVRRPVRVIPQIRVFPPVRVGPRIQLRPRVRVQAWSGPTIVPIVPNPLLKGGYATAFHYFERLRAKLYKTRDPKAVRKLFLQLERRLVDVRQELWKLEQAKKRQEKTGGTLGVSSPRVLQSSPFLFSNGLRWNAPGYIKVGGQLVLHNGANSMLTGEYRKAVDELHAACKALETTTEPEKARQLVDKVNRKLLDARAALWRRERTKQRVAR